MPIRINMRSDRSLVLTTDYLGLKLKRPLTVAVYDGGIDAISVFWPNTVQLRRLFADRRKLALGTPAILIALRR